MEECQSQNFYLNNHHFIQDGSIQAGNKLKAQVARIVRDEAPVSKLVEYKLSKCRRVINVPVLCQAGAGCADDQLNWIFRVLENLLYTIHSSHWQASN